MFNDRPKRSELHMKTAFLWANRSLCKQDERTIGCVITTRDMKQILSFGYNGPPKQMGNEACENVKGHCGCLHAEMNAVIKVDGSLPNKIMFVTMAPCEICAGVIAQANISKVYYQEDYRSQAGLELLKRCGIPTIKINLS